MSATWYGVPVTVQIDFTSGTWVPNASLSYTDVTADVVSCFGSSGRTSELSSYAPGGVTVTLKNLHRKYDRANTAGPYYGNLLPRRRIQVLFGGVPVFTGFIGAWVAEWPEMGIDARVTVTATDGLDVLAGATLPGSAYERAVVADDPLYYWQLQEVDDYGTSPATVGIPADNGTQTAPTTQDVGAPIGASLAAVGTNASLTSGSDSAGSVATIDGWFTIGAGMSFASYAADVDASGYNYLDLRIADYGIFVGYSNTGSNLTGSVTIGGSAGYASIPTVSVSAGVHHVAATVSGSTVSVYVDGQLAATGTLTAGTTLSGIAGPAQKMRVVDPLGGISHVAMYDTALTADQIAAHYLAGTHPYGHPYGERGGARIGRILDAVGWPTADRALSTGETVLGDWLPESGDALSACRAVEVADQGMFFAAKNGNLTFLSRQDTWTTTRNITPQAAFGDDSATEIRTKMPLSYDQGSLAYTRNVVSVSYGSGTVTSNDATSVTAYGELPDSVSATIMRPWDGWLARQLAAFRLRLRATPQPRVPQVAVNPHDTSADGDASVHIATLAALELGDRVQVNRRPNGATDPIQQQATLQGVRWSFSPAAGFDWQGYLSPAAPSYTEGPYLTVGDATYGKIGASDGNTIPF